MHLVNHAYSQSPPTRPSGSFRAVSQIKQSSNTATSDFTHPTRSLFIVQSQSFPACEGSGREGRERVRRKREGDVLSRFAGIDTGLNALCLLFRGVQVSCFLLEGKLNIEIGAYFVVHLLSSSSNPPLYCLRNSASVSTSVCVCVCLSMNSIPQTYHTPITLMYQAMCRHVGIRAHIWKIQMHVCARCV